MSGLARYHAALEELEEIIRSGAADPREEREGLRFLAGMSRWATSRAFLGEDTAHPVFVRCMDTLSKWGLDNPDNIYLAARIRGDTPYRISGERGTCADLAVEVLAGMAGDRRELGESIACLDAGDLTVDETGRFEILVGAERTDAHHLATRTDADTIFVRITFGDWLEETPARLTIEPLEPLPPLDDPPDDPWDLAAQTLSDQTKFMLQFAAQWRESAPRNALTPPSAKGAGFLPGQRNSFGQFDLAAGEVLLVEFEPVPCRYHGFASGHHRWFTSFDYRNRTCSLNTAQAHRSRDGRYRYVVSPTDPGVPNWIDTDGQAMGFLFMRWQGVTGDEPGQPGASVVPLSRLRDALPPGEATIDANRRARERSRRRHGIDRRFE